MNCTTHFNACDCREQRFREMERLLREARGYIHRGIQMTEGADETLLSRIDAALEGKEAR